MDTPLAGTLRSTPVDLFARRALRWVQTRQGAWVLSLGSQHGTLRLRPDGPETWQVVQVRRDAESVQLGDTLPLPYAQGLAEDYARHLGVARLVETEAPWRQHPATEKQTALLRKLGMTAQVNVPLKEAKDILVVPREAIRGPEGQKVASRISPDGRIQETQVQTGRTYGTEVELLGGLDEGDVVAVYPAASAR